MLCPGEEGRCEDRGAEGRTLFYDHLGLEQLQETYIPSAAWRHSSLDQHQPATTCAGTRAPPLLR